MSKDSRKKFILTTTANYFGINPSDKGIESLTESQELNSFLDDGNCFVLIACGESKDGKSEVHLSNKVDLGKKDDKVIVFFKVKPEPITPDNLHTNVFISSMLDSPISALFYSLQKVYAPALLQNDKWSDKVDPKIQDLLSNLQAGLGTLIRRSDSKQSKESDDSMSTIFTPSDEYEYWLQMADSSGRSGAVFSNLLRPLDLAFKKLDSMKIGESEDVVEEAFNDLDDLWKAEEAEYPEARMKLMMDVIGNTLCRFIQSRLADVDLWKGTYSQVEEQLNQAVTVLEQWIDNCNRLTTVFWPNYFAHKWKSPAFVPEHAKSMVQRLNEVMNLRMLHKQLTKLLSTTEQEELKTKDAFVPFAGLNPLQYNPYTDPLWKAAVQQFQNLLKPAEQKIAGKLRMQLRNMQGNALQLMQEFKRYRELIKEESIRKELIAEREMLLGQLLEFVKTTQQNFRNQQGTGPRKILDVPQVVNNIYWARHIESKAKDIEKTGDALLSDLNGYSGLKKDTTQLLDELQEYHREQFDSWSKDTMEMIKDKTLSLATEEQVVEFERGKHMKVNYNRRLVGLIREVRQLIVLGYSIPSRIIEATNLAKKFMTQAKALEQVANFHNTIGDRIIKSQRPMMLEAAMAFAQLVQKQQGITWNNTQAVDEYIIKLQAAVEMLSRNNNRLVTAHNQIKEKVLLMMDTDLLRQQQKWKDLLKEIRGIFQQLESADFKDQKTWRAHWDRQIYKALEHQYQHGLEVVNQHLPELKVELVYRNRKLQFAPPIEEIRLKYYSQLKRFLNIPNNFRGVGEGGPEASIYPIIIERNAFRYNKLFHAAEELFQRLESVKDKFEDWVALGSVDMDDLIQKRCKTSEDYDKNFRASKSKGQEIGRLPSTEEKIDCITVSFSAIRSEIEIINRRYWDALVSLLQHSIIKDCHALNRFATDSSEGLKRQPQTIDEVGESAARRNEIMTEMPEYEILMKDVEKRNRMLANWTKEKVDQVAKVSSKWDNFQSLVSNYDALMSKQIEALKSNMKSQAKNHLKEVERFAAKWHQFKPKDDVFDRDTEEILKSLEIVKEKKREWDVLAEERDKLMAGFEQFGMDKPDMSEVEKVEKSLLDAEASFSLFEEYHNGMNDMLKEEWIVFRSKLYRFEEYLAQWNDKLQEEQKNPLAVKLLKEIEKDYELVPALKFVRGDAFSEKHWNEMYSLLGIPTSLGIDKLTFGDLMRVKPKILENKEALKELNGRATGEVAIRQALQELDAWEIESKFTLVEQNDSGNRPIKLIKDWKDLLNKVGDLQCLLQSLKDSPYYQAFLDRAGIWERRLADLDEYLANLNQIQRKWVYLEPIFGRGALPKEQSRFKRVNDDFRSIMGDVAKDPRVVSLCKIAGLRETLNTMMDQLGRCQKSLSEFLEEKRSQFPRFYFIGDDDLLEILGQATNPTIIQSHLKKLFAGIYRVDFDDSNSSIVAMKSLQGEVVKLKRPVHITKNVEGWLQELANEMKSTLKTLLVECMKESQGKGPDPLVYPSQILCLSEGIMFTEKCEKAIEKGTLKDALSEMKAQLESYTSQDIDTSDEEGKVLELKLKSLILDTIHNISVVEDLIASSAKALDSWTWQKQLRYYMRKDGVAVVRMVDAEFEYTYEYQGNASKLVHTPLTDKCYLTLTQAMHMGMGGNPYGPAGTGKTESVKAMGNLFGRQVLVFNCDEGIDVQSMGRIFIGLVKCGAWGCFDEFNRLDEAVLSAVSMQIQVIQAALKSKEPKIQLLGNEIDIDYNSGIFITMNPAGKGYGGRSKLPDNLKQLFRPVAMTTPDNELITETILYSEGFKHAKSLGKKLTAVFNLSKQLLSAQQHYDWGLRAQKTVLGGCGNLLTLHKATLKEGGTVDEETEAKLIVQAVRLNTMSKLTFADTHRFDSLIKDVFTGIAVDDVSYDELVSAIKETLKELGLMESQTQIKKAIELYEQLNQRMGCVVVGPSGCGKTTLWKVLRLAMIKTGRTVKIHTMNPKAMPRTQLLGHIDMDTREWFDGVLTNSARLVVKEPKEVQSWIICDGDIDPEWIESLNSVLDDNRLLTMPSGERIQFAPNVNFLFETHDLSCASPATISRMGMIFLSDENTDVDAVVSAWVERQPEARRKVLAGLIEEHFHNALEWVLDADSMETETTLIGTVMNGLSHLSHAKSKTSFGVALIHGLGGNLTKDARAKFAKEIFTWVGESPPDGSNPLNFHYNERKDHLETYGTSQESKVTVDSLFSSDPPLILTPDVQCTLDYFRPWLEGEQREPFLMVGPEGSGKTQMLYQCFKKLKSTQVATVHCSAQTTPQHILQKLSQVCIQITTNTGRVYRPKESEWLVLYLKDINLPKPDKWGTCQLIAFLQQVVTYNGFWDQSLEWVGLEHVQIVGSMIGGKALGRHELSTRFTSIVRLLSVDYPELDQVQSIYAAYLTPILNGMSGNVGEAWSAKVGQLAESTLKVYQQVQSSFSADDQSHYVFSMRNLTDWLLSLIRYDVEEENVVESVLEAWAYEACRLFRDRLVTDVDQSKFDKILYDVISTDWGVNLHGHMDGKFFVTPGARAEAQTAPGRPPPITGKHLGSLEPDDWQACIMKGAHHFVAEQYDLDMFVFREVLETIARVERVLSSPGGSLLMAGRSGVGRRTAVGIAACMLGAKQVSPKMGKGYGEKQFRNDLKSYMQMAAIDNDQVVFILEDHQVIDPSFLEMVNSLLCAGEIPGLFAPEEIEPMVSPLRDDASQEGFRGPLFSFFSSRVKKNLHVAIIMDFTNPTFVVNCQSNPALIKECNVLWMSKWSKESMTSLPMMVIAKSKDMGDAAGVFVQEKKKKKDKRERRVSGGDELLNGFLTIHQSMPGPAATPRKYMQLMKTYLKVYKHKKEVILDRQQHLKGGVDKLNEATAVVDKLKKEAGEQEVKLNQKQGEANKALKMITNTMKSASKQKEEMEALKDKAEKESVKMQKRKVGIDKELAEVEPVLAEARKAVGNIKPESLSEVRSLRAPPDVIRDILEGVMGLLGIGDTSWNSMKSFLAQRGIKEDIMKFDAHSISVPQRKKVEKILKDRGKSFEPATAKRASQAAAPLASWVRANVTYAVILEKIKPLEDEQNSLQKNIHEAQEAMDRLGDDLGNVEKHVEKLTQQLNKSTKEAATIEVGLTNAKETLTAAENLVGQLSGEYKRWTHQLEELQHELETLPLRSLLAAAFINYLSDASEDVREAKMHQWCEMLGLKGFEFRRHMSSEREMLTWKGEGLPSDDLSVENGVVVMHSSTVMFLIDPSSRAIEWLKTHLKDSAGVEVVTQQEEKFATQLEMAVRFGKTLIIQEVDHFEPVLFPLIRQDVSTQGTRKTVQVGDKMLDYNENFRLYLATRNPDPNIPPDCASILTTVNFITTKAGLTGQLLALTLQSEKPELEVKRRELLKQEEENKIKLSQLEDKLLHELANAKGNILENKELLASLTESKSSSATIAKSIDEGQKVQETLSKERDAYLPLAESGSCLYFILTDLCKLNNMYHFSLGSFMALFSQALKMKSDGVETSMRIATLKRAAIDAVFSNTSRSLFKADRLMFSLHVVHGMNLKMFHENEWEAFTGQLLSDVKTDPETTKKQMPAWITEDRALAVSLLKSNLPKMWDVLKLEDTGAWTGFATSAECEKNLPSHLKDKLTPFQKLLVVQALRPDRLQTAMIEFATSVMGHDLSPPPLNLRELLKETVPGTPVLILISTGADPSEELRELAKNTVGLDKFSEVAMGQGQAEIALSKLKSCSESGQWLCLKNLHLVTAWLPVLEKELLNLTPHDSFRLWLTAEPHGKFTPTLLQSSLKVTYEAPPGVKKNLVRSYTMWGPEYIASGGGNAQRAQALFALAWFHAVVQERRSFIPQGWTKFYEFNFADLKAGADILDRLVAMGTLRWDYVHGLMENAIYGGRVDNKFDLRVLVSYLENFFNGDVISGTSKSHRPLGPGINLPTSADYKEYLKIIKGFSETDKPVYFGLPANIDRSAQRMISANVISQLKVLMRSLQATEKFDRDKWQKELSPVLNLWKKLNSDVNLTKQITRQSHQRMSVSQAEPITSFIQLEHFNALCLAQEVHRSLANVSKVIRGTMLLSPEVKKVADSLLRNETPGAWQQTWEGPEDPFQYLRSLVSRTLACKRWVQKAESGSLISEAVDLSELFHPDTFLNALRQQTARMHKKSMDDLVFVSSWAKIGVDSKMQVKITGLQLEGCAFDGSRLTESRADSPSVTAAPVCTVAWVPRDAAASQVHADVISMPLYMTQEREKVVVCLDVPCSGDSGKWIQSGAAMFLKD
ncbi:cytoplasmic dynein 2 heavy chain 1-like [Pollicipes pollicipes]|uniref:cytoplasmic dynein 2 heavy chain 1-like n=1 Tax=Pollicipes pollicipes TaxID=41117 RepID=UPI0018850C74|nr:cytoplasmic dynein 2 heavy chain 1-like [Pollicipes pollicipes]